jgi:hypothetical protein
MRNEMVAGVAIVSLTIGAASGYFFAKKQLQTKYDQVLEEELAKTKEFYSRLHKTGDYSTPEAAVSALVGPAADALLSYQGAETRIIEEVDVTEISMDEEPNAFGETITTEDYVGEVITNNIWQSDDEPRIDTSNRDPERPYIITVAEFMANDMDYEQSTLTYFAGDNVVADEQSKHIPDIDRCVGLDNLEKFGVGEDPNTLLIRNERLKMDFEVAKSDGKYAHEVLGLSHSDDTFERTRARSRLRGE